MKYTSTTPINYKEELKEKGAEKPAKETSETQTNKAQEPKKKKGFGFGNFFNQFKDDNMFTDNEA